MCGVVWCGVGVVWVCCWCGVGVVLVWCWCGVGVVLVWWCGGVACRGVACGVRVGRGVWWCGVSWCGVSWCGVWRRVEWKHGMEVWYGLVRFGSLWGAWMGGCALLPLFGCNTFHLCLVWWRLLSPLFCVRSTKNVGSATEISGKQDKESQGSTSEAHSAILSNHRETDDLGGDRNWRSDFFGLPEPSHLPLGFRRQVDEAPSPKSRDNDNVLGIWVLGWAPRRERHCSPPSKHALWRKCPRAFIPTPRCRRALRKKAPRRSPVNISQTLACRGRVSSESHAGSRMTESLRRGSAVVARVVAEPTPTSSAWGPPNPSPSPGGVVQMRPPRPPQ